MRRRGTERLERLLHRQAAAIASWAAVAMRDLEIDRPEAAVEP
jgi:hypothetical protein